MIKEVIVVEGANDTKRLKSFFDVDTIETKGLGLKKETIEYILDELDKQLPGIKSFTINNFSIYSDVMNGEYESDPVLDEMINNTIQNECNIKKKERKKTNY